jgi:hypothetical protein
MLARYKKGGGIVELVKLIEDSAEPKRTQLMTMIRNEDPEFAAKVDARLFSFEKIKSLPEDVLAEIIATTPVKFVAMAIWGETSEFVTLCERCLGKNYNEYKSEKETLTATPPAPGQIEAARRKVIAEARKLESSGAIKLPYSDGGGPGSSSDPAAPGSGGASASEPAPSSAPASPAKVSGNATSADGVPTLSSFNIEAPPPGLSGERLETYLKTQLGF